MALNTQLTNAAAIAACDAIVDLVDGGTAAGTVKIYTGTQPASGDAVTGAGTLLVTITLNDPAFGTAADAAPGGQATADVTPSLTGTAVATGTAAWFRVEDSAGTNCWDGSVGTATADMIIDNTSIASGQTVTISSWTVTMPES